MEIRAGQTEKSLLRFTTTGSVDDGKSTLIGRLLYETNCIFEDQYAAISRTSHNRGQREVDLSLLLDGLSSEREQGITIDVAYRYFETDRRKFIIADTPGHEQYTRNMVTGASTAQLAIILIDARQGVLTQSRRHGFLVSLLQIPHLIVAVNKMDLVDYDEAVFNKIVRDYTEFSQKLNIHDIHFIPVSALKGDNVTTSSDNLSWYKGHPLLHLLETIPVTGDRNLVDFRLPVQVVLRPDHNFRGYGGTIASGTIRPGEEIAVLPSGKTSKISAIVTFNGNLKEAFAGQAVALTLEDELDISRGDMIVRKNNLPYIETVFDATLCWMGEENLNMRNDYILKHTTQSVKAFVTGIKYRIDVNTLHREETATLALNDIARVHIRTGKSIFFDAYNNNHLTGNFILIDPLTNATVAAGMIRGTIRRVADVRDGKAVTRKSTNVTLEKQSVSRKMWEDRNGHKGAVLWLTGYSGSGKSTVARALVQKLFSEHRQVMMLDGDNIRHGLCGDLGFSDRDRSENIRRVGETAKLFFEQGNIVVCTFISPFRKDRDYVRTLMPEGHFFEVYIKCDLEVCKRRDPKGLYKKAATGEITEFTGVTSPYEDPPSPDIVVETDIMTVGECAGKIADELIRTGIL